MSNPFQEHAQNFADYETMLQGDDASGGATMTIAGKTLPCTHSNIITGFQLVLGGQSANTFIEHVEFLAMNLPANFIPTKGIYFSLYP